MDRLYPTLLLIFGFAALFLFQTGFSFRCYKCNSYMQEDCADHFNNQTWHLSECAENVTMCRKIVQEVFYNDEWQLRYVRQCAPSGIVGGDEEGACMENGPARWRSSSFKDSHDGQVMITCSILVVLICLFRTGEAVECYQCDSNEDGIQCPADERFDTYINAPVDCNGFEAHTPGQFCMKITQESPGWRGWRKVTRRCGSRTDSGVAWGCLWSWDTVGVFREICYCESNRCNSAAGLHLSLLSAIFVVKELVKHTESVFGPVDILINNASVKELVKHTESVFGPVDILVNNAGVMYYLHVTFQVKELVKHTESGFPGLAVYSGTKFYVEGLSQALRQEVCGSGVRVTCIQPGDVKTELISHSTDKEVIFSKKKSSI
ncbi:unnamed protein product [Mytilus edulis]|uniref:UPAR/Ly6 domain-containing protein qvr n=1 Tax=Mytilus edulis TaxID=6550 RepID=A0A8S3T214_MYTED|nr:unnamed protein product [Mytilus edulis]